MQLQALARALGLPWEGDGKLEIHALAGLVDAGGNELSFVASTHHRKAFEASRAGAFILPADFARLERSCLRSSAPYVDFARAIDLLYPRSAPPEPGVHSTAVLATDVVLGKDVSIGAYAVVGAGSRVGDRSVLRPHVTLYPNVQVGAECEIHSGAHLCEGVRLGDRVVVQNGAVIGGDGFGFAFRSDGTRVRVPHRCGVEIGDDAEIGANVTIDAAHPGHRRYEHERPSTRIGAGTKIDNLVHVAHGVEIGEGATLCAGAVLGGGVRLGRNVYVGGHSTVVDAEIGDDSFLVGRSGVHSDLPAGSQVAGLPAMGRRAWARLLAAQKRLPELLRRVRRLEAQLGLKGEDD